MHVATIGNHREAMTQILQAGARIEEQRVDGWTPFLEATLLGHVKSVEFLIKAGAKVKAKNSKNETRLHLTTFSTEGTALTVVPPILAAGLETNAVNKYGHTTLFNASSTLKVDLVLMLLHHSSDETLVDTGGLTAFDSARHYCETPEEDQKRDRIQVVIVSAAIDLR